MPACTAADAPMQLLATVMDASRMCRDVNKTFYKTKTSEIFQDQDHVFFGEDLHTIVR